MRDEEGHEFADPSEPAEKPGYMARLAKLISVDPAEVLQDAREAGLRVESIADFHAQAPSYAQIQALTRRYGRRAVGYSALGGASSGIGGPSTVVSVGLGDLANMAAQLYRFCQRAAILHGFDPENALQEEYIVRVYLSALGYDAAGRALLEQQLWRAARSAGRRGAKSNWMLQLVILAARMVGTDLSSRQAVKFLPVIGGALGAGLNYAFAKKAVARISAELRREYFRRQASRGDA